MTLSMRCPMDRIFSKPSRLLLRVHQRKLEDPFENYPSNSNPSLIPLISSHPDKSPENRTPEGQKRYRDLSFALEVLTDPEKRQDYEELLEFGKMLHSFSTSRYLSCSSILRAICLRVWSSRYRSGIHPFWFSHLDHNFSISLQIQSMEQIPNKSQVIVMNHT